MWYWKVTNHWTLQKPLSAQKSNLTICVGSLCLQVVSMSIFWWKSAVRTVTWVSSSWTDPRLLTLCATGWWGRWDRPWMPSKSTAASELSSSPAVTERLLVREPSVFLACFFFFFSTPLWSKEITRSRSQWLVSVKLYFCVFQREPTLKRCRIEPSRSVTVGTSWLTGTECPRWRSLWLQLSTDLLWVPF